jgi:prophage regulatory protein
MRLLSKAQVQERVLYSPTHLYRLEKRRQFPQRVRLGPSRVGWVESEVDAWIKDRMAKRTPR